MTDMRQAVLALARERYGTETEYLWPETPENSILRHPGGKWYAVLMRVSRSKLHLAGDEPVDVLNTKCGPLLGGTLRQQPGILPAYHMNKEHWISILLDGTVDMDQIAFLLELSYDLAREAGKKTRKKSS